MNIVLPLFSSIVAFVFAVTVLDQFFTRRKPYQLVWAISLFMYFISTGAILPAFGGTLMRFGGSLTLFYLLELLGIIIIFVGFLRGREVFGFYRVPLIHGFSPVSVN